EVSTRVELPERADVLVTDQIGRFGFEEGLLEHFADATRRLLKPAHRAIPSRVSLYATPVEAPQAFEWVSFWKQPIAGLTFDAVWRPAASTGYPVRFERAQLLSEPGTLGTLALDSGGDSPFSGAVSTAVSKRGTLHGIGCWFEAQLSPSVSMTNSPV